jgi:endonuclease/exonuclease/phosphatase family metal-dependent hydrolase
MVASPFSVMTYNVENLFDSQHDAGKNDYTYLPLTIKKKPDIKSKCKSIAQSKWKEECLTLDWSDEIINEKLRRIAQVILSATVDERGPDILFLQEVENLNILRKLNREFLQAAAYQSEILIEGQDPRGIDVAILSRFPTIGKPILHEIPFQKIGKKRAVQSRGILQSQLKHPSGLEITSFATHFPAPYHPPHLRQQAFRFLNDLAIKNKGSGLVIAAGDFNITSREEQKLGIFESMAKPIWEISHKMGCHTCLGTYFYRPSQSWSFLDVIMILRPPNKTASHWVFKPESIRIVVDNPLQNDGKKIPLAFTKKEGVSDHLPVIATIVPNNEHPKTANSGPKIESRPPSG